LQQPWGGRWKTFIVSYEDAWNFPWLSIGEFGVGKDIGLGSLIPQSRYTKCDIDFFEGRVSQESNDSLMRHDTL